jgi:hypothetical protein
MSTRVYNWDSNPAVDRFSFRCSDSSAEAAVNSGQAEYIVDGEGRRAIQKRAHLRALGQIVNERGEIMAVNFASAWKKIPSGGIPVWQMRKPFLHALQLEGL